MNPTVITPTRQDFNGTRYYLSAGRYFQREGRLLHIEVWSAAHGRPPAGHQVHHRDHDRANNRLDNLELLTQAEHLQHHGAQPTEKQRAARRENQKAAMVGNARLTPEQRAAASKRGWEGVALVEVSCSVCGTPVLTPFPGRTKYCGLNCRQRALQRRYRAERGPVPPTAMTCVECGMGYSTPRPDRSRFCSTACKKRAKRARDTLTGMHVDQSSVL